MIKPIFISAIGTPLDDEELLHEDGLAAHLSDQWDHGISGCLVAGGMGCMQLLRDETYEALAKRTVELSAGKGEIMFGAGDCSFARTRQRIQFLNQLKVDGVVVLTPYFFRFSQAELVDYYRALADLSRAPLYLYDLPALTHCKVELNTVLELSRHPNIRGIKCSDAPEYARQIVDELGDSFRVILAQPVLLDVFLRAGLMEHLDGMYAIAPQWTASIGESARKGDWTAAAELQKKLTHLRALLIQHGVFPVMSELLNARGIPGRYAPRPYRLLSPSQREQLLSEPVVKQLIA